jgi:hypothetical protein
MKDHEAVTLKAFLVALSVQSEPLTPDLQNQLHLLSENLLANLVKLDAIARQSSDLSAIYKSARQYFDAPSERNKGLDFPPDAQAEKQNTENLLIDNITQLRRPTNLEKLLSTVQKIDNDNLCKISTTILKADDSVKEAQDNLSCYLSSYPLGKAN